MVTNSQAPPRAEDRWTEGAELGQKYRLVRRLDEGGMGTVWVAHNSDLELHVALKLIRSDSESRENADRLLKEARILARLDHPGIVRVFDAGRTPHGEPFIVMELLNGESLAQVLVRDEHMAAARAIQLLLPLVEALGAAHELGIVHRDVKPENVFLAKLPGGRVQPKLLDFGIARIEQPQATRITSDGALLGSPSYMSPEQARGELDVDLRADIWGLCVVLYELVTGRRPFGGVNYNATLRAIIEQEPEPLHAFLAGDTALSSIVERGLKKQRGERWQSMKELGAALAEWLLSRGIEEDVTRASLRSSWSIGSTEDAPWSVPPVAVPAPGAPPSLSPRAQSRSSNISELDASLISELETISISARAAERSRHGLSTNGHGAVSITNGAHRRRSATWLVLGAGGVAITVAIGWGSLRAGRGDASVAGSAGITTGRAHELAPAARAAAQVPEPKPAERATPVQETDRPSAADPRPTVSKNERPRTLPGGSRASGARRNERSTSRRATPAQDDKAPVDTRAAAETQRAPSKAPGTGSTFRPRGL